MNWKLNILSSKWLLSCSFYYAFINNVIYKYLNLKFVKSSNIIIADNEIKEMKNYNEVNYVLMINDDDVI